MVKTIYADVFFLINFIINYLILFTSGYISARYICRWKLFLAAAVGALYGFTVFLPAFPFCTSLPVKLFISCLMVFTSFGFRNIIKNTFLFLAISFIFGGAVFAVTHFGSGGLFEMHHGFYYIHLSASALIIISSLTYILLLLVFRRGTARTDRKFSTVTICSENKSITVTALHDTGNSLRAPGSNANIIISDYVTLREILPENVIRIMDHILPENFPLLLDKLTEFGKFGLVPYQTIEADFSLMLTYHPKRVLLDGRTLPGALIGFSPHRISSDGAYSAII
ncbi:MAG: hypothetical protein E7441_03295 [Ruminococcaceae bacterium]|nr:hypothetical protein [Oscillospiraceae bacterium]